MPGKRLLLINPTHGVTFWGMEYALDIARRAHTVAPLGIITVAALTPETWQIDLVDENVEPVDLDAPCDVVGITAMNVQSARAFALADAFRKRGRTVVIGGPYATLEPERCAPHADVLVVGEAERTWPAFCREYEQGRHRRRYVESGAIDLAESPVPRFDLLRPYAYTSLAVQTTRGCPFTCEFCDIIVMQGRRVRTKPIPNVLAEIDAIRRQGTDVIFFNDDNFVGNQKYSRDLLDALADHRHATGYLPLLFTQASVNLADKPALLEKMVSAGFNRVFLGIESPRQSSLREAGKRQNTHGDLIDRIHTIQRAGLVTWAGMIVGFDHDDVGIFREQADFLDEAGIAVAMVGMLNAPPRTPLFKRLLEAGRIDPAADWADNCSWTNIVPLGMTRGELFRGYAGLLEELYDQRRYTRRLLSNIGRMKPVARGDAGNGLPTFMDLGDLWRATRTFTFSRDPVWRRHFLPTFARVIRSNPTRAVEAAIHLGIWKHFTRYVPELVVQLHAAASADDVRARERAWQVRRVEEAPVARPVLPPSLDEVLVEIAAGT